MKTIHIEIPDRVIYLFRIIVILVVLGIVGYMGKQGYGMYTQYQDAIAEHIDLVAQVKGLKYDNDILQKSNDECFAQQDRDRAKIETLMSLQQEQKLSTQP